MNLIRSLLPSSKIINNFLVLRDNQISLQYYQVYHVYNVGLITPLCSQNNIVFCLNTYNKIINLIYQQHKFHSAFNCIDVFDHIELSTTQFEQNIQKAVELANKQQLFQNIYML